MSPAFYTDSIEIIGIARLDRHKGTARLSQGLHGVFVAPRVDFVFP